MIVERQRYILLIISTIIMLMVAFRMYFQPDNSKEPKIEETSYSQADNVTITPAESPPFIGERSEIVRTEIVECGGKDYIFDLSLEDNRTYYNNIYGGVRSPENLLVNEIASRTEGAVPKRVIAVPSDNCDRVFLAGYTPESEVATYGVYEWQVESRNIYEILGFKEFNHAFLPRPFDGTNVVSDNGIRIIIAQREDGDLGGCNADVLRLHNLREGTSEILVRLVDNESLDVGIGGEFGYCEPNYGWIDGHEVFYDVFDATTNPPYRFIERRTLKIE